MKPSTLTLDQLILFISVAEEGSFSATARRLHRAQSAVSYNIQKLEQGLGLQLFDRSSRRPVLTPVGRVLLRDARRALRAAEALEQRAASFTDGLEIEVRLAVSAICPTSLLVAMGKAFQREFPTVALRIQTEVLEGVAGFVRDGRCDLGISEPIERYRDLSQRFLLDASMVPVASSSHSLARINGAIPPSAIEQGVQIVISQKAYETTEISHSVFSSRTWHVADANTKLGLILAGLGWGYLPFELVKDALHAGELRALHLSERGPEPIRVSLSVIHRKEHPLGPAARWLTKQLPKLAAKI